MKPFLKPSFVIPEFSTILPTSSLGGSLCWFKELEVLSALPWCTVSVLEIVYGQVFPLGFGAPIMLIPDVEVKSKIWCIFLLALLIRTYEISGQLLHWPPFFRVDSTAIFSLGEAEITESLSICSLSFWFSSRSSWILGTSLTSDSPGEFTAPFSIQTHITGTWLNWKLVGVAK